MKYDDLVERIKSFEEDHTPEGWPAIKMKEVSELADAITTLQAELEQCRKDAERLDWLSHSTDSIEYSEVWAAWTDGSTLRCAIDKAMESV